MSPAPGDIRDDVPIDGHVVLGHPGDEVRLRDGQDFRVQKGQHGHALHHQGHGPGVHSLVIRFAAVGALVEVGVNEGQLDLFHGGVGRVQACLEPLLAFLQSPGQSREARDGRLRLGHGLLPGRLVGVDVGEVPLVLGVHILALHVPLSFPLVVGTSIPPLLPENKAALSKGRGL